MLKSLMQPLQLFIKGASGRDRQDKQQLSQQLLNLRAAYNQIQSESDRLRQAQVKQQTLYDAVQCDRNDLDTLLTYADKENQELIASNQKLRVHVQQLEEKVQQLQSKLIYLDQKADILTYQQAEGSTEQDQREIAQSKACTHLQSSSQSTSAERTDLSRQSNSYPDTFSTEAFTAVNLSNVTLALIGGHETTHREVSEALKQYGLKRCIHVPPHSIASNSRSQIKDKISQCDLIVTITTYVDHSVVRCVKQLKEAQMLAGDVIRVSCHGKSGVVREVMAYFSDHQVA